MKNTSSTTTNKKYTSEEMENLKNKILKTLKDSGFNEVTNVKIHNNITWNKMGDINSMQCNIARSKGEKQSDIDTFIAILKKDNYDPSKYFPPLLWTTNKGNKKLIDGFHRLKARYDSACNGTGICAELIFDPNLSNKNLDNLIDKISIWSNRKKNEYYAIVHTDEDIIAYAKRCIDSGDWPTDKKERNKQLKRLIGKKTIPEKIIKDIENYELSKDPNKLKHHVLTPSKSSYVTALSKVKKEIELGILASNIQYPIYWGTSVLKVSDTDYQDYDSRLENRIAEEKNDKKEKGIKQKMIEKHRQHIIDHPYVPFVYLEFILAGVTSCNFKEVLEVRKRKENYHSLNVNTSLCFVKNYSEKRNIEELSALEIDNEFSSIVFNETCKNVFLWMSQLNGENDDSFLKNVKLKVKETMKEINDKLKKWDYNQSSNNISVFSEIKSNDTITISYY